VIEQMPELTTYMPNMRRYLLDFPNTALPNATSFLYWQESGGSSGPGDPPPWAPAPDTAPCPRTLRTRDLHV
jgi:hypothetical protein